MPIRLQRVQLTSFDYYRDRGKHQIRIHVWGWLGRLLARWA
jgi:hypothetical protein